jgi:hypothetical protein
VVCAHIEEVAPRVWKKEGQPESAEVGKNFDGRCSTGVILEEEKMAELGTFWKKKEPRSAAAAEDCCRAAR